METKANPAKTTVVIILAAVLFTPGRGAIGALHESTLTINAAKVAGDKLTDFVVYVDLAHMDHGFWDNVTPSSGTTDIVVKKAGGAALSREIVWLDKDSRKGEMHFKADSLSGTSDTSFIISVGGGALTPNRDTDTWSNGYLGVWHLQEATNLPDHSDSTAADKEGHRNGNTCDANGKFGAAQRFDGSGDYIGIASLGDYDGSRVTVSAWAKLDELPSGSHATVWGNYDGPDNRVSLFCSNGDWKLTAYGKAGGVAVLPDIKSAGAMSQDTWQYVSVSLDGPNGNAKLYLDDAEFGPGDYSTIPANLHEIGMLGGSHFFDGLIDEFRISSVVRSADSILTEYNNQSSPGTFYTLIPEPATLALLCGGAAAAGLFGPRRKRSPRKDLSS